MPLTQAQYNTLKADILADPILSALPPSSDAINKIIAAYALDASPAYYVWRNDLQKSVVFTAITWARYIPVDAPDATTLWTNRNLQCQACQLTLQSMLLTTGQTLDMSDLQVRNGVKASVQNIPSGALGATQDAGWNAIRDLSYRPATRLEKLFATGTGTTGSPAIFAAGTNQQLGYDEVRTMMGW